MQADFAAQYARVVVDTNVLLSAALSPTGAPSHLVDLLLRIGRLVFSNATFAELETRLWLPKFDRYLTIGRRKRLLHDAGAAAHWVEVAPELARRNFSRDTSDDAFIHAALAGGAMRLVSGDNDLLLLDPVDSLRILTPRAALQELAGRPS